MILFIILFFVIGLLCGVSTLYTLFNIFKPNIAIKIVEYSIVLKSDENVEKHINTFHKYYWNNTAKDKDIKQILLYAEDIRTNIFDENNYIVDYIDVNYDIDFTNVYIKYVESDIYPIV